MTSIALNADGKGVNEKDRLGFDIGKSCRDFNVHYIFCNYSLPNKS